MPPIRARLRFSPRSRSPCRGPWWVWTCRLLACRHSSYYGERYTIAIAIVYIERPFRARRYRSSARRIASPEQKADLISRFTDVIVEVEKAELIRPFVYVIIDETGSDGYGLGGNPVGVTPAKAAQR